MKMCDYVSSYSDQLEEALNIGKNSNLRSNSKKLQNIVVCGLGGSGIGGNIVKDIIAKESSLPLLSVKNYDIPKFIDSNTLVIASSYSGNTEETISALEKCVKKNAEIAIITSGGKLKKFAEKHNYNHIIVPGNHPPRAMFAYSFVQLFYVLYNYNIISDSFKENIKNSISLLNEKNKKIKEQAKFIAEKLFNTTPIIYVADGFEGVAVRFRQQINENSKMLCWHQVIPEMNHNELLGWRTNTDNLSVIFFRNKIDNKRNQIRIDINKSVISKYTKNIIEVWSEGETLIENTLYHIHLGDWVSWYLSEMNEVDAIEIDVINYLKTELAKI
tara:strand:+ start:2916 stop:3905 length:990 start_codon:yes stop_codon:yes gene_type:complete